MLLRSMKISTNEQQRGYGDEVTEDIKMKVVIRVAKAKYALEEDV